MLYRVEWTEIQEAFVDADSRDEAVDKALEFSDSRYKTVHLVEEIAEVEDAEV